MADPDEGAPILSLRDVAFSFGERRALGGVSLEIRAGELLALLGPNGAGKTTLIRTIAGRAVPSAGSVAIAGRDPATDAEARRQIGLVPQQIALYPTLTCRENLRAFGGLMGLNRAEARARGDAVLRSVGLADRAGDQVQELSGGMQRRLNIAAAILHAPRLLVLDEPTVGVDPHAKEAIHALLLGLKAHGMAILLATHDMEQAALLADRVAIIAGGLIRVEGKPAALVADAFAGAKEVMVTLAGAPDEPGLAGLQALGLLPFRAPLLWAGQVAGGYDAVATLDRSLQEIGLRTREIALREPTLASVFFRAAGRDLAL